MDIFPKKIYKWPVTVREDAQCHNHQGNANQNHDEIEPQHDRTDIIKEKTSNKYWRGCGKNGSLAHY